MFAVRLLVVESWAESMGGLLPRALEETGHHPTFLTRDPQAPARSRGEVVEEGSGEQILTTPRHLLTVSPLDASRGWGAAVRP